MRSSTWRRSPTGRARRAWFRASDARCWRSVRPSTPTREPPWSRCSTRRASAELSTRATTPPTSTPSARSRASTSESASPSPQTKHPRSWSAPPTWSSPPPPSCSRSWHGSDLASNRLLQGKLEDLVEALDRRALPRLALLRQLFAGRSQLERGHSRALGSRQLVVGAVPDEQAVDRLDAETLAGDLVDAAVRLRDPDVAREDGRVELVAQRRLVPHLRHIVGADADHPEQMTAAPELLEGRQRLGSRHEDSLGPLPSHRQQWLDVGIGPELAEERAQMVGHRAVVPVR